MDELNKRIGLLLVSLLLCFPCNSQKQANVWYFGRQIGLDFNVEPPQLLLDGKIDFDGTGVGLESAASISDENGQLLFYSNGVTVWNKLHQVMQNGSGLYGTNTTTQTLIVPVPGSKRYYIFTASPEGEFYPAELRGFRYSVVDLSQDGGLGAVTEKNTLLSVSTTEKMVATKHANGRDAWVVMHEWNSNKFRAYLITDEGLQENYAVSQEGTELPADHSHLAAEDAIGQMKFSASGEKLAFVAYISKLVEGYDFDLTTGKLSLSFSISKLVQPGVPYGLEFSPSGRYLFISLRRCEIIQLDLASDDIAASAVIINQTQSCSGESQLQLAPDGKIYVAHYQKLSIGMINNPNELGKLSDYDPFGIIIPSTGTHSCRAGLPNFISSYFYKDPVLYPQSPYFEMPNVFTPNSDYNNEIFEPISKYNIKSISLSIYNRWGNPVFQTNDLNRWWDGQGHPAGVYYWQASYTGFKNSKAYSQKGFVQLMR